MSSTGAVKSSVPRAGQWSVPVSVQECDLHQNITEVPPSSHETAVFSPHNLFCSCSALLCHGFLQRKLYTGPCIHPKRLLHLYGLLGRDGRQMESTNLLLSERVNVAGPGAFVDVIMAE